MLRCLEIGVSNLMALCLLASACSTSGKGPAPADPATPAAVLTVTSSAFKEGESIPRDFTCDGSNVSPDVSWSDPPVGTKSLAIIAEDPDAPIGTFVHWVIYDLPPDSRAMAKATPKSGSLASGAKQGKNDFGDVGYGGPCPPSGTHRYYFRVYALNSATGLGPGTSRDEVVRAMNGHVLAEGHLMGRYKRLS